MGVCVIRVHSGCMCYEVDRGAHGLIISVHNGAHVLILVHSWVHCVIRVHSARYSVL